MRHLSITLLLAFSSVSGAREFETSAGIVTQAFPSSSMDAVRADVTGFHSVTIATEAPIPLAAFPTWIDVSWIGGSTAADDFQAFNASLDVETAQAGLRAEHALRPWLYATARAAVGVAHAQLALHPFDGSPAMTDGSWGFCVAGALGLDLRLVRWRHGSITLRGEGGWLETTSFSFAAKPETPDDGKNHLRTLAASLGSLDPSGPSVTFSLVARF
jgi:hypothetical protein